jgi:hypothetical protein
MIVVLLAHTHTYDNSPAAAAAAGNPKAKHRIE